MMARRILSNGWHHANPRLQREDHRPPPRNSATPRRRRCASASARRDPPASTAPERQCYEPPWPRSIRAPRGTQLTCKGWQQEAALRMLMNNLDPDVAERPQDLVVYGGTGKAARSWEDYHVIVRELRRLENDQTLLVQSGRAVGVFRTHEEAPRVLIANSNLVGKWATWEHFRELEQRGLMMYGQMTAGSWIYIGTQGIVQGTFETFAAAGKHALRQRPRRARSCCRAGSAAWAARSRSRRRWPAACSSASRSIRRACSGGSRRATSTRSRPISTRALARVERVPARRSRRARSRSSATRPTSTPSSCGAASRRIS